MPGTRFTLEVQPQLPKRLVRLSELANDLYYSWERQVRALFRRLDPVLWDRCGHNPKVFLRQVSQEHLDRASRDRIFIQDYNRVLSSYDIYLGEEAKSGVEQHLDPETDLVAYFCAEFGFHESVPIYSGGLGILAGDHCKAASDLGVPFVAVGLLYRQGYFTQTIDGQGDQIAHYRPSAFGDLPVQPATDAAGNEVHVQVMILRRKVTLKVWRARAGHIQLYLLDSDLPENNEHDRAITYQLYGGDRHTRIQQEIVLGIGGVRALRALGLRPTVWHINEGHSAFQVLERARERVSRGLDFDAAIELIAGGTVFTTHTPVPAGHDIFPNDLVLEYFGAFMDEVDVDQDTFLGLGESPGSNGGFSLTSLALRGSRFHNGVSRIHGRETSRILSYNWPQIPPEENPIGHVSNGIHVPTFLAREWVSLFDMRYGGGWRNELLNPDFWHNIDHIPDYSYWSLRRVLKSALLEEARGRAIHQHRRNGYSESQIERLTRYLYPTDSDTLIVGFARRFATYKRATLLFSDPERLARLVNDREQPVIFIFAGKAHPMDEPGQQLIKTIYRYSGEARFEGRIIMLENYDMALARKLVAGVDVWLNNPEYPLEASGTSGQKAAINGAINLSVTDGWWGEGYDGENGWAITPHGQQFDAEFRDREEADELMVLLEEQVKPLYYQRNRHGYSDAWVQRSKRSMKTVMPRFNAQRMLMDYLQDYYGPAIRQRTRLMAEDGQPAQTLARWKRFVRKVWPKVTIRRLGETRKAVQAGECLPIDVAVDLRELTPDDVQVECLLGTETWKNGGEFIPLKSYPLTCAGSNDQGETLFHLDLPSAMPGLQFYKIRMYPYHELLSHRFELGYMLWV